MPLENIKIQKPIFFIGVQGGGLTIISRSIRRHENVVTMRGDNRHWTSRDELMSQKITPKEFSVYYPENGKNIIKDNIFGNSRLWWAYATNRLFDKYYLTEQDYSKSLELKIKNLIRFFIRGYSKDVKKARYLEKSQLFLLKIRLLKKIFPDAKFILVTRNPYAICSRIARREYIKGYPDAIISDLSYEERLVIASQHWRNSMKTALEDLNKINEGYIIKIEDYLKNPKKYLKEILDYCELSYNDDLLPSPHHKLPIGSMDKEKWYPLKKEVNQKYLKQLSNKDKKIITETIGNELIKKTGYENDRVV